MRWPDTVASQCRYGEDAGAIWGDWDVLWENSENDYQGHAAFLARKGRRYVYYEWTYGSCSGCDTWEAENADVQAEMRDSAIEFKSKTPLLAWLNLVATTKPADSPGYIDVEAIKTAIFAKERTA